MFFKAQTNITGTIDIIDVSYDPSYHVIEIGTYDAVNGWQSHGSPAALTLAVGDRFGAAATEDGEVRVYHNTQLVLTVDITAWPHYANGGFIGLAISSGDRVDGFDGGQHHDTNNG